MPGNRTKTSKRSAPPVQTQPEKAEEVTEEVTDEKSPPVKQYSSFEEYKKAFYPRSASQAVKRAIDRNRRAGQFLLTGSADLLLNSKQYAPRIGSVQNNVAQPERNQ